MDTLARRGVDVGQEWPTDDLFNGPVSWRCCPLSGGTRLTIVSPKSRATTPLVAPLLVSGS